MNKQLDLLLRENIKLNCSVNSKEEAIRKVGQLLVDSGYVLPNYVEAMLEREKSFATYMGNGLALPHGVEAVRGEILASGIAVLVVPDGVDWGGETAYVIIGIAGVGNEHLDILAMIAEEFVEDGAVEKFTTAGSEEIYKILGGNA